MDDLRIPSGPGLPGGLVIDDRELVERFSRSGGPGGQSVNTADSRVELSWDVAASPNLTESQRARLLRALDGRLIGSVLTIAASEQRSQLQNRQAARGRLAILVRKAFVPEIPRRATRPSRAARQRRMEGKRHRGELKSGRGRIRPD
jgi:ribosome-associated protein